MKLEVDESLREKLTAFLTNETNPYPLDLSVCGSLTTLQSLQQKTSSFVKYEFSVGKGDKRA